MRNVRTIALVALLVLSAVTGVSPAAGASGPPSGMVAVAAGNVADIRPSAAVGSVSASDLEGDVYVSQYASTTEVSIVTTDQADKVARGLAPGSVAHEAVCSSPAAAKNPNVNCAAQPSFALVLSDSVHHDGRRVAIKTSVLESALGYVPQYVTVRNNETGQRWQYLTTQQDGWTVIQAEHFSSNSVTWSGSFDASLSPATDGSTISYEINDLDSASDPTINLTGETSTEWDNESGTTTPTGKSSITLSGNADPLGPSSSGDPVLSVTSISHAGSSAYGGGGTSDTISVAGSSLNSEVQISVDRQIEVTEFALKQWSIDDAGGALSIDVYLVAEKPDGQYGEGTKVLDSWQPSGDAGYKTYKFDNSVSLSSNTYTIEFVTRSSSGGDYKLYGDTEVSGDQMSQDGTLKSLSVGAQLEGDSAKGLSATLDGSTYNFGDFTDSETKNIEVQPTVQASEIDWSASSGRAVLNRHMAVEFTVSQLA